MNEAIIALRIAADNESQFAMTPCKSASIDANKRRLKHVKRGASAGFEKGSERFNESF
jgi:hypothetical protein